MYIYNIHITGSPTHRGNVRGKKIYFISGGPLKAGSNRVLFGLSEEFPLVSIVGLGKKNSESDPEEEVDENKEAIRKAVAAGCKSLKEFNLDEVVVDPCSDGCSAAEGASLSLFSYQELKQEKKSIPKLRCFEESDNSWLKGLTLGEGQNIARRLMEMPSNLLTPSNFAQEAVNYLEGLGVEVRVRTKEWAEKRNMNAFLTVAKGSEEPPIFLELIYKGTNSDDKPFAIVGKGITFDSGGISLKPSNNMDKMRADMGGAACTVGSIFTAASLKIPINIKGFIPLCENMPSGTAVKPGDVIVASNGKSIQVDNTDAEGRLILADALHYASQHKPRVMLDMATLTGAMAVALGAGATGVFSNSSTQFNLLHKAGYETGDRVWRMPLWKFYENQVKASSQMADMNNQSTKKPAGGAPFAAGFLKQFVTCDQWLHLDIAGVMENSDENKRERNT
ncbi:Cytosol aminopeptidase [Armadillidium nasatum]|uniref:Cytosol aminopeptidase n=1 Tax=Armadillidium nasatum TaxID=96803 RepID=A0A5N5TL14_9CRUS|nr:Cytosol aminopeptidase [Armadillidium nasatum]